MNAPFLRLVGRLVVSSGLILALAACSSPRSQPAPDGNAEVGKIRHPNLSLYPVKLSPARLISSGELLNAKHQPEWRTKRGFLPTSIDGALTLIVCTNPVVWFSYIFFGDETFGGTGGTKFDKRPAIEISASSPTVNRLIKLSGLEVLYVPAKGDKHVVLALAVGDARVDVSDEHGSYYCRADEIHYRASTKEILLKGQVSVSASYAPGIHDFGLVRIDLDHCVVEYAGSQSKSSP